MIDNQYFKRWNEWRKCCSNSKFYKLLVLLKIVKSLSLDQLGAIEEFQNSFMDGFQKGLRRGR